jgi:EAL domain-containing protein (putative c-di-GMP-specific phosphodiesterase class I)
VTEEESKNENNLIKKVNYLRENGIQIAVDDFGSGYSNETRILSLLPDIIKIDMEMIQGIHGNADKRNLVANLVEFCHHKGVKVIAEGIEEKTDLVTVIEMGLDYAQGFYIGKPVFEFIDIDETVKKEIKDIRNRNID